MRVEDQNHQYIPPAQGPILWLRAKVRRSINITGAVGIAVATAGHAYFKAPFDIRFIRRTIALPNLSASFEGFRIAQFSDLHTGGTTPIPYLHDLADRINALEPDLVAVTGDLVSHSLDHISSAADILSRLKAPVVVILGNHDYDIGPHPWFSTKVADAIERELHRRKITLLRNASLPIERGNDRLWIVGLEEYWSGRFDPAAAFKSVNTDEPVIALTHNPDSAFPIARFGAHYILAGHTHGGQIRLPFLPPLMLPLHYKQLAHGEFEIHNSRLYVTSGVGFRTRIRFRCPPEIPIFTLTRAP